MLCSLSSLDEKDLGRIKSLEDELGSPLLAFSCHKARPAVLDGGRLAKLQALEQDLGVALVALEAQRRMAASGDRRTLFVPEAKTGPNYWLDVKEVYGLEDPPARHPDSGAAVRARYVPEPLLKSNRLKKPKYPPSA